MKCSLGISDFLEEIPSLSHSVVFLYFFGLITEEGFLILLTYILVNTACHVKMDFLPVTAYPSDVPSFAWKFLLHDRFHKQTVHQIGEGQLCRFCGGVGGGAGGQAGFGKELRVWNCI